MTDLYRSTRPVRDPEPPRADLEQVSPYAASIPRREVIPQHPQHSVRAMMHDFPSEICGWNAHPEYEIHLITKTHGSFIAGDHIGTFGPGHLSLIGPNLPHDWVSDLEPDQVAVDRDAVIQFTDGWIRQCMQLLPELQQLDGCSSTPPAGWSSPVPPRGAAPTRCCRCSAPPAPSGSATCSSCSA